MHVVDRIADAVVGKLDRRTDAANRVARDRGPGRALDRSELPFIDVRVGEDDPQTITSDRLRSEVSIHVDLYVRDREGEVSASILALRDQVYRYLMATPGTPLSDVSDVMVSITPAGAGEILRNADSTSTAFAMVRTTWVIDYHHSLTDASVAP